MNATTAKTTKQGSPINWVKVIAEAAAAPPARRVLKPVDWLGVVPAAAEERAEAMRAALGQGAMLSVS